MNLDITKIIDQYIQGELSEEDKTIFEKKLAENPILQKEVNLQQSIYEAAKRSALRTEVKQVGKRYHLTRNITFIVISILVALTFSILTWLISVSLKEEQPFSPQDSFLKELEQKSPIEKLGSQFFVWNGKDSIMISPKGVLLSIPENAWLLNGEPYRETAVIQWQEALDAVTIMKNGLSTMSGDKLLETQGMFGIKAYTPLGELLTVNPKVGIYVQVPVTTYKPGMQLFEGKKNKDGIIDWQNPKPLGKIPIPVDIKTLDFYPVGYEDSLNKMKLRRDKKYRDSLYLSFAKTAEMEYMSTDVEFEPDSLPHATMFTDVKKLQHGKSLFLAKCNTCHNTNKESTGPPLAGVRNRWAQGGAKQGSVYRWVKDWQAAALSDPYAYKIMMKRPTAMMTFPDLKTSDIDAIFDYADNRCYEFIDPAKVLAFWKPEFNNTNLATREFEKRMRKIHATCDEKVLEIYTRGLSSPLSELDKKVAEMGYWEFQAFAAENVGKVNVDNPHLQNLSRFYEQTIQEMRKSVQRIQLSAEGEMRKKRNDFQKSQNNQQQRVNDQAAQILAYEYEINLENTYKQLGEKRPQLLQLKSTIGFTITSSASIYNIDRFVAEATALRKSSIITDQKTGKTAKISYNDFSFEVQNSKDFDQIYAYVMPELLNSYQRITGTDGKFNYALNNDIIYDMIVIGINANGYAYFIKKKFNRGNGEKISLTQISEKELDALIEATDLHRSFYYLAEEINWLAKEQKYYTWQKNIQDQSIFRDRIRNIIFPCRCEPDSK